MFNRRNFIGKTMGSLMVIPALPLLSISQPASNGIEGAKNELINEFKTKLKTIPKNWVCDSIGVYRDNRYVMENIYCYGEFRNPKYQLSEIYLDRKLPTHQYRHECDKYFREIGYSITYHSSETNTEQLICKTAEELKTLVEKHLSSLNNILYDPISGGYFDSKSFK